MTAARPDRVCAGGHATARVHRGCANVGGSAEQGRDGADLRAAGCDAATSLLCVALRQRVTEVCAEALQYGKSIILVHPHEANVELVLPWVSADAPTQNMTDTELIPIHYCY